MSCPNYESGCEGSAMLRTYFGLFPLKVAAVIKGREFPDTFELDAEQFIDNLQSNLCEGPDYGKCDVYKLKQNLCSCAGNCKH